MGEVLHFTELSREWLPSVAVWVELLELSVSIDTAVGGGTLEKEDMVLVEVG